MTGQDGRSRRGTVEELLRRVETLARPGENGSPEGFELWVPQRLTLRGQVIPFDVAIVVVLDALLEKDFVPASYSEEEDGRLYLTQRFDPLQPLG